MKEAAERQQIDTTIIGTSQFAFPLNKALSKKPDVALFLDKDIALAERLELAGVRLFNRAHVIERCDHKGKQAVHLHAHHIPMPTTILAPKSYPLSLPFPKDWIDHVSETLGFPLIVKEAFGSFGMTVYLVHSKEDFIEKCEQLKGRDFLCQQYVASSHGRDIRVNVIGQHIVAAMYRHSDTDFRANITNGGKGQPITLTPLQEKVALQASALLELTLPVSIYFSVRTMNHLFVK